MSNNEDNEQPLTFEEIMGILQEELDIILEEESCPSLNFYDKD